MVINDHPMEGSAGHRSIAGLGWAGLSFTTPQVMGILNVTPDSFSDGGRFVDTMTAVAAGMAMVDAGAAIVDVGGESTRPGAQPVPLEEELRRVIPVVAGLSARGARVSIDTRSAAVMAAALEAGAKIVNDVSALRHDRLARQVVATHQCPVVLMHMRGTPQTMSGLAQYTEVAEDVANELSHAILLAESAGIQRAQIAIDPGFGFAKSTADNRSLMRNLSQLRRLGGAMVVGISRKTMIGAIAGVKEPAARWVGSLVAGLAAVVQGAHVLRVHDVAETVQAVRVWQALTACGAEHGNGNGSGNG